MQAKLIDRLNNMNQQIYCSRSNRFFHSKIPTNIYPAISPVANHLAETIARAYSYFISHHLIDDKPFLCYNKKVAWATVSVLKWKE